MGDVLHGVLADDGRFPNSRLPLVVYTAAVGMRAGEAAAAFEEFFASHDWGGSWRNGVHDFHHYHSMAHEVLGVSRGSAVLRLGGPGGVSVDARTGSCIVIPAGVAHCRIRATPDFQVVGAYPLGQRPDMCLGRPGERPEADRRITALPLPDQDPVEGGAGWLLPLWEPAGRAGRPEEK
jgi:uncharacterized protein YjlB